MDRRQKVQLEGAHSSWQDIPAGVPQGSILGPLFLLIYTHDLPGAVQGDVECEQFADDTALLSIHMDRFTAVAEMQLGVSSTSGSRWLTEWRLQINASETYAMEITRSTLPHPKPCIRVWDSNIELTNRQKHLGLVITSTLTLKEHTTSILQLKSLTNPWTTGTSLDQIFPRESCTAQDILCMLHTSDLRICVSCLRQCNKK